jgi:hypothetical protein
MKITDFWDVAPCSLVEVYRRFRGACCLHHQGDDGCIKPLYHNDFEHCSFSEIYLIQAA